MGRKEAIALILSLSVFGSCSGLILLSNAQKSDIAPQTQSVDTEPVAETPGSQLIPAETPGTVDGRTVAIGKYQIQKGLSVSNQFAEPVDGTIVLVPARFKNSSTETGDFAFSAFTLVDDQGREYEEITDLTYSLWRDEKGYKSRSEEYYPDEFRDEILAFRVAPGAAPAYVEWKGIRFDAAGRQ